MASTTTPGAPCGGVLTQSIGIIQSPRYPNLYPSNANCQWTIQAPEGSAIVLQFQAFDLEEELGGICFDAVQVGDGDNYWLIDWLIDWLIVDWLIISLINWLIIQCKCGLKFALYYIIYFSIL